jgi:2-polyprenyl-3-methyl-5-hydroxy-6-metoxy-1,4-benzoquinol methylase
MANLFRSAYRVWRFDCGDGVGKPLRWLLALPVFLSRIECDGIDIPLRYLAIAEKGRMLDVGCGNGAVLKLAHSLGWQAEGVDFDALAVGAARRKGVTVRLGRLADQHYAADSFDLVHMSHVIEHVHDPLGMLSEIYRILRRGGVLVVATPNGTSWGHRHFHSSWFALDPPRHLHIFNEKGLSSLAQRAGFSQRSLSTTLRATPDVFVQSTLMIQSGRGDMNYSLTRSEARRVHTATLAELIRRIWNPLIAAELLLEARK